MANQTDRTEQMVYTCVRQQQCISADPTVFDVDQSFLPLNNTHHPWKHRLNLALCALHGVYSNKLRPPSWLNDLAVRLL